MKKVLKIFLLLISFITFINLMSVKAEDGLIKNSKSAIAIDATSGNVLYDYNSKELRYPASTTKIMSLCVIMDALDSGKISMSQVLTTSEYAASMGGSQIFLSVGEKMTVKDLLYAVVIASANDATVVLAEAIAGTEDNFVKMMMNKASELNLISTTFKNATGLHSEGHVTTANELAIIARELINKHGDTILPISSTYESYLRQDTEKPFWLVNTNKLIKQDSTIDGLKTGWTNQAGYCLVCTKNQNGMRIITVVMGGETSKGRNADTLSLMNYVYSNYDVQLISPKGAIVQTETDLLTKPSVYNIVLSQDVSRVIPKGSSGGVVTYEIELDKNKINNNYVTDIGKLKVYIDNKLYTTVDLNLEEKVEKKNFFEMFVEILKNIL